jgi:hypothetical protein
MTGEAVVPSEYDQTLAQPQLLRPRSEGLAE